MPRTKRTTPKALQVMMNQEGTTTINNGVADSSSSSSFRVLYYGDASAGSVPFMWESHPGTPKHASTESSLPPLTPPPSYNHFSQKYNSSKQSTSLRSLFLASSSRKTHVAAAAPSYSSVSYSLPSTPVSERRGKTEIRRRRAAVKLGLEEDGDEKHGGAGAGSGSSPELTLCFGGGFMKVRSMKKVTNALSIGGHRKA